MSIGTKKKDKEAKDSGGEASANYMIAGAPVKKAGNNIEGERTITTEIDIAGKLKEKVKDTKDKVAGTADKVADTTKKSISSASTSTTTTTTTTNEQARKYEEGEAGTRFDRTKDSTKEYDEKEPMSPAKIKQHDPTAVRRDPNDQKIVELGQEGVTAEDAKEKARVATTTREVPEKQIVTSMSQDEIISAPEEETTTEMAAAPTTTTTNEVSRYQQQQQQREQQQSLSRALDESRDNIRKYTDEARKEIPRYTQAANDYQEQTIQASREIADNYIESQKEIINSLQSAWLPQIETANRLFTSNWMSPRYLTQIYANMVSSFADNMIAATRLVNNMMFANMDVFKNTMQQAKDNAKELSRIGVNSARRFEQTSRDTATATRIGGGDNMSNTATVYIEREKEELDQRRI